MTGPRRILGRRVITAVERKGTGARAIRLPCEQLQPHGALQRQNQRRRLHQLRHRATAHRLSRREGELEHGGAGKQHLAEHRVVGEPGMVGQRKPRREQHAVMLGKRRRSTQQGMRRRRQPGSGDIGERTRRPRASSAGAGRHRSAAPPPGRRRPQATSPTAPRSPGCAARPGSGEASPARHRHAEASPPPHPAPAAQRRAAQRHREHRMRAHLDEHAVPLREQGLRAHGPNAPAAAGCGTSSSASSSVPSSGSPVTVE